MAAGLRVDLLRAGFGPGWYWRLWNNSRIIGGSTEIYDKRSRAISNLESVTGGLFEKISTPDFPAPFGLLRRELPREAQHDGYSWQSIPVRLVEP